MVVLLLVLALYNVPGQFVVRMHYEVGHPFYVASQFEHGWPFTWLIRDNGFEEWLGPAEGMLSRCFEFWSEDPVNEPATSRPWALLTNVVVLVSVAIAGGSAFELWRRKRRRLWHLHLRDLLVATLALSLVAARYVHVRRQYMLEQAVFWTASGDTGNPYVDVGEPRQRGVRGFGPPFQHRAR